MKIMLVAGEASGDLHGAHLATALRSLSPGIRLFGMGGRLMEKEGVRLLFNPTAIGTVGFTEALRSIQVFRRLLVRFAEVMDRQRPDALVLIDFPGFNMRLAELACERQIPVVYFFSPSAWAWGEARAHKVARTCKKVAAVFPFEYDVYKKAGADVVFVGHPLLDLVKPSMSRDEARQYFGVADASMVVALLPGSRTQEIRSLLPPMLGAAQRIARQEPAARFLLPVAHTVSRGAVETYLKEVPDLPVRLIEGHVHDVMNAGDVGVIASGTATLEAALIGLPMVIVYKISAATYWIAKRLVKIPNIGLPNIVAGVRVVPELLQQDVEPDRIAFEVMAMWRTPDRLAHIRRELAGLASRLGEPGAVMRTARLVLEVADGSGGGSWTSS